MNVRQKDIMKFGKLMQNRIALRHDNASACTLLQICIIPLDLQDSNFFAHTIKENFHVHHFKVQKKCEDLKKKSNCFHGKIILYIIF